MCGICGKFDLKNNIDSDLLTKMVKSMNHRGPDSTGFYESENIGMAHKRLKIIDLSESGNQPMCNEDRTIWLVFNGEIYDWDKHRSDLIKKGHMFKSNTDSEVIIHLYEEYNIGCVKYLNGQFAFAIWDNKIKRLYIARDRVGIKPLYYFWNGNSFVFTSELKSILCDNSISKELDFESLDLYLTLNYIPCPKTIFKNIKKLEPAHHITVDDNSNFKINRYWDITTKDYFGSVSDNLFNLLNDSVCKRMISDTPLGAFLSGGIDSSTVVSLMSRNSDNKIKTFSIGYDGIPGYDESKYAREVAEFNNTEHHEYILNEKEVIDYVMDILNSIDEPFADSSAIPTYILSDKTSENVKVAMSGDGGDELFAGYRMYQGERFAKYYSLIPKFVRNGITNIISDCPDMRGEGFLNQIRKVKKFTYGFSDSFVNRYCKWREIFPRVLRYSLTHNYSDNYYDIINEVYNDNKDRFLYDDINTILYMDFTGLLHNDILTKVDRMSMANSLEVRTPLLDHNFVNYVFNLKSSLKLKGKIGKKVFIETFKYILPATIYNRTDKMGFEIPINLWLKKELKFLVDFLDPKYLKLHGLFDCEVVKELIDKHMSSQSDISWQLWNLIVFQYWYKNYIG